MNVTFRSAVAGDAFIGNPFSTRHTRPGALAPLDAVGRPVDVAGLCKRLASQGGSGAIVGAHGSGKTTLLDALARGIEARADRWHGAGSARQPMVCGRCGRCGERPLEARCASTAGSGWGPSRHG